LATLASRIDPGRCAKDPKGVLEDAAHLVRTAEYVLWKVNEHEEWEEGFEKHLSEDRTEDWVQSIKEITGEHRLDRATKWFTEFMAGKDLTVYKRDGFTSHEVHDLTLKFAEWKKQPKRKKGKQGRRISDSDGRVRIGRTRLLPIKSQRAA
jgi:hypothetical protein